MKQKRPFRFAKTSCAIASILVVSTLTGIFLAGCESPSSESMPSTASSETESHPSSLTSSQVSFAVKSVSELASYEDVPFQVINSTDHTPVDFLSFPEYWGNVVICGTDHQYAFRQMFSNSESHPTAIPYQTVLTVSFGAYAPKNSYRTSGCEYVQQAGKCGYRPHGNRDNQPLFGSSIFLFGSSTGEIRPVLCDFCYLGEWKPCGLCHCHHAKIVIFFLYRVILSISILEF